MRKFWEKVFYVVVGTTFLTVMFSIIVVCVSLVAWLMLKLF